MKIVHELNQLDFGGAEKVVSNIIKFDKKNEHCIIAYKGGEFKKELEKCGAKIIIVDDINDSIEGDADVIHVHSGGDISPIAQQLSSSFPIIETIHSPIRSPMNEQIFQRVGVSEAVSRLNNKCITIKNGVDFNDLIIERERDHIKKELGIPLDKLIIGRLGRLGMDKGLEDWLLTCYKLQQQGLDFVPLIVGDEARNANGYKGRLKLIAECLPVNNVKFVSNRRDVQHYMQLMDVFLYPSKTEGFGLVFIEAMASGCVVVSYDTDVNREIIGGYSVLTDVKKGINGLVDGVNKALNQDVRDAIIGNQYDFIEAEYSAERMSQEYQELYEQSYADFNRLNGLKEEHLLPA